MNAADVAALRELLGREDVIEAAAKAEFNADQDPEYLVAWPHALSFVSKAYRDRVQAAFAAVLELARALPAQGCQQTRRCPIPDDPCGPGGVPYCWDRPPVLSTVEDDLHTDLHPEPGDPASPLPDGVQGFALPPRIRVDPDLRTAP